MSIIRNNYLFLLAIFLGAGCFIAGMAYVVQGRAFGFENVPFLAVVPAFFVGSISGSVISFLVIKNRNILLDRLTAEQDVTLALTTEVAERKQTESRLRESEGRFRTLAQIVPVGIFETDANGKCIHVNQRWCDITGMTMEDASGTGWVRAVHPEDVNSVTREWEKTIADAEPFSMEFRFLHPDGGVSWVLAQAAGKFDGPSRHVGFVGSITDISEHKEMEIRLYQAVKMEAVGQLTGGVAHDFNNLLLVIQGNAQILSTRSDEYARKLTKPILRAAARGAELTQRLLAFSRKQNLQPKTIDLGELVSDMRDMLIRTLSETIEIEILSPTDLKPALADPGQVENALLNLAINARDAMPNGGKLTIECENVLIDRGSVVDNSDLARGDYVVLTVSDTGEGMPAEIIDHVFEPFFTTKEVGEGSGLGLSMIYGFAKQSRGHVTIDSVEGRGTSVRLYLPCTDNASVELTSMVGAPVPEGNGEHVLIVEDDEDVRKMTSTMVKNLGYRETAVGEAKTAAEILAHDKTIDIVLSDVILPGGVSGPQFVRKAKAAQPGLKVIFMSGYPAEFIADNGGLEADRMLLNKPFDRSRLAQSLRAVLES